MKLFLVVFFVLIISHANAQNNSEASGGSSSCDALGGAISDSTRTVANSLHICKDLEVILQGHHLQHMDTLNNLQAVPSEDPMQTPDNSKKEKESDVRQVQELKARQRISEAIARAMLDSNLVMLQSRNALLEEQVAALNAEQRAYRRTKLLNAFLGTTVGAIGSGMQFSNNVTVQHAGDAVSVGGGAITAVFALCTADIDVVDTPPDNQLSEAFRTHNQDHQIPDEVWSYLKNDDALRSVMENPISDHTHKRGFLSCHLRTPPPNTKIESRNNALRMLDNKLLQMNRDLTSLSALAASE